LKTGDRRLTNIVFCGVFTCQFGASPLFQRAVRGLVQALQESGLSLPDDYLKYGTFLPESGYCNGCELMKLSDPPTAIFCCNNSMTLGLMRALAELKISCPERVSVLGFDDFEWGANFRPQLTSVAQPTYEVGRLATEQLIERMRREKNKTKSTKEEIIVLPDELRIRDSTAPPYKCQRGDE